MPDAAVHIRGVRKQFTQTIRALENIDLDVAPGEFVCLLGPSGCGKSTLLNVIAGFIAPDEGTVEAFGKPVRAPGPERAMVFQEYALFPWMTVLRKHFDNDSKPGCLDRQTSRHLRFPPTYISPRYPAQEDA